MATFDALTPEEQQQFAQQLKYAQLLRQKGMDTQGQMVSGIYVPKNPWENLLNSGVGSYMERSQNDQKQSLMDTRAKEYDAFVNKRPGIYNEQASMQEQAGPPMEGDGPLPQVATGPTERVLKGSTQMLQDQNDWMGSMGPTQNPLLNSIRQQSVTSDLGWPEKMVALEQTAAAKKQLEQEKAVAKAQLEQEKAEARAQLEQAKAAAKAQADATTAAVKASQQAIDNEFTRRRVESGEAAVKQGAERTAEIVATATAKRDKAINEAKNAKEFLSKQTATILERAIAVRETPNLNTALGFIGGTDNRFLPTTFSPRERSDALQKIKSLEELLQSVGLIDVRNAGVSPGSITEKEWSKFSNRVADLKSIKEPASFRANLDKLIADLIETQEKIKAGKLDEPIPGLPGATSGAQGAAPTVVKRVPLTQGQNAGKTGVLWSNGDRTVE